MGCCVREAKTMFGRGQAEYSLTSSISTTTSGSSKLTCARTGSISIAVGFAYRCDRSIESHNSAQCTEVSRIKWLGSEQMGQTGERVVRG
jgi:hypothetical protein